MASECSIRIPADIITDIFYCLPVKSLGRFRCVSKDWLTLISESQFIKTHHNFNINNTHKRCHLILSNHYDELYSLQSPRHEAERVLERTKIPFEPHYFNLTIHGSCNGLVLMSGHNFSSNVHAFVLNPTTGEFVRFQHPIMRKKKDVSEMGIMYGFGYDSVTNHYKVVAISYTHSHYPIHNIHVYSLRTNTWRRVNDSPYNHSVWSLPLPGIFVNGFLHWVANKESDGYLPVIVAFGLAKQKFTELPWPNFDDDDDDDDIVFRKDFKLVVVGGKLAIFMNDEMWLMNEYGVTESWTKVVVLHGLQEIPKVEPLRFYDNGKILMVSEDHLLIHDIGERTSCNIPRSMNHLTIKGTYVESLVSPKFG